MDIKLKKGLQLVFSLKNDNNESKLFKGLNNEISVARYHSLIGSGKSNDLKITAYNSDGEIMAVEHKEYPIYGLQFHPESILTDFGMEILKNFLM